MNVDEVVEKIYEILLHGKGGGNARRCQLREFIALLFTQNGSKVNIDQLETYQSSSGERKCGQS